MNGQPRSEADVRLEVPGGRPGRIALSVVAAVLLLGLVLALTGHPIGERLVGGGLVTLVAMPAALLAGILFSTIRRRDWRFAATTLAVAGLLVVTLFWSGR